MEDAGLITKEQFMNKNKFAAGLMFLLFSLFVFSCQKDKLIYDFKFDVAAEDGSAFTGVQTLQFSGNLVCSFTAASVAKIDIVTPEGWTSKLAMSKRTITISAPSAGNMSADVSGTVDFTATSLKGETKTVSVEVAVVDAEVTFVVKEVSTDESFLYAENKTYALEYTNVSKVTATAPTGWTVTTNLSNKTLSIVAPSRDATEAELEGTVSLVPESMRGTKGATVSFNVAVSVLAPSLTFEPTSLHDVAFSSSNTVNATNVENVADLQVKSVPKGWTVTVNLATVSALVKAPAPDATDIDGEGTIVFTAISPSGDQLDYSLDVSVVGINSAADFLAFANAVNTAADLAGYMHNGEIVLNTDVDLSGSPKANYVTETFTGNFNGKGHTITLSINTSEEFTALFKRIEAPATIHDLKLAGNVTNSGHNVNVAGLTCFSKGGTYTNISTSIVLSQTGTADASGGKFGALVADEEGSGVYTNCHNTGALTVSTARYVGGLIGSIWDKTSGTMTDCSNIGALTCNFSDTINMGSALYGGVVGTTIGSNWNYIRCFNKGNINYSLATSGIRALGGFSSTVFGYFEDCYNTGNVVNIKGTASSKATRRIGGFAGTTWESNGYVAHCKGCYNTGEVSDITNFIGGFIGIVENGKADNYHKFENCYNSGKVTCLSLNSVSDAFGGFAGTIYNVALLQNCKNSGKVLGYTRRCAGGLVGRAADNVYIVSCENSGDVYVGAVDGQLSQAWSPVVGGICGIAGTGSTINIQTSKNTGKVTAMVQWAEAVSSVYACEATARQLYEPSGSYPDLTVCDEATKTASAGAIVEFIPKANWTTNPPASWF